MGRVVSLSVAAIQPPAAIYREEQRFGWWLYALLALVLGLMWGAFLGNGPAAGPVARRHPVEFSVGITLSMVLPVLFVIGFLKMTTVVTPTEVRVWFGWIPTYRRAIPIGTIARVEVVQYRPIADYGGWGIRHGRDGEKVLSARGDRGVRLRLIDGSRLMIGSQRPEELVLALEGALRTGI
jgi:hypothetical protein